ncbi:MAG TPA: YggT family protein [Thermodesulfobacteriota bacterium]|nr:YggT family protein [Thermodesulfobacteriota bacterium]
MVFLAYFFDALANVVDIGLTVYMWIVVIRAVVSWVNPDPYNPIMVFLRHSTDPVLNPIRRRLPISLSRSGIDLSPLILLLIIYFLKDFLVNSLYELAKMLH